MTKKMISWLSFMTVFLFLLLLQSCRNDDLLSSPEKMPSENAMMKKGGSVSLWKEDETYIRKVQEIYNKHANESYIRSTYGTIFWEYAMTMDTFNESYLVVPVLKDNKVVRTLEVFRVKNKIYFQFSDKDPDANDFFQALIFTEKDKISISSTGKNNPVGKGDGAMVSVCRTITITVGYVEGASGDQYPISNTKTICKFVEVALPASECLGDVNPETGECGGGSDGGGYDYPDTPDLPDPCEKLKAQNQNQAFKDKITDLKSKLSLKKESGFGESKSGVFTELPQAASTANSDGMTVTVTPSLKGYIHTHLNDYQTGTFNDAGEPLIAQPIRMFSPADVNTLMTMAGMAIDGNYSELYGTMVSSYGNYTIMFTGTAADIKTGFDTEQWRLDYLKYRENHEFWSFEKLFLNFVKEKMNIQGIELYKIKDNGTVQKKNLNSNNNVQSNDCPQ